MPGLQRARDAARATRGLPPEKPTPEALIASYLAAYRAANGAEYPYEITYVHGWFHFGQPGRYRRSEIERRTRNLVDRAIARAARATGKLPRRPCVVLSPEEAAAHAELIAATRVWIATVDEPNDAITISLDTLIDAEDAARNALLVLDAIAREPIPPESA